MPNLPLLLGQKLEQDIDHALHTTPVQVFDHHPQRLGTGLPHWSNHLIKGKKIYSRQVIPDRLVDHTIWHLKSKALILSSQHFEIVHVYLAIPVKIQKKYINVVDLYNME